MIVLTPTAELPEVGETSIFLAGPTPRDENTPSWRPDAIAHLRSIGFKGQVLVPESFTGDFDSQVAWEIHCLDCASIICFWVPRCLQNMPAFTTNVEFGRYVDSGRAIYGRPDGSPKTRYLDWLYMHATAQSPKSTLSDLLHEAASRAQS